MVDYRENDEIEKTEQMVSELMNLSDEELEESEALFEVSVEDINSSLQGIETSNDASANLVRKLKKKTNKTISQLADEVVEAFIKNRSDDNWKAVQEFFWYGVKQFSYKYTQNWDDAYDMTIETFIRALEAIDSYDPEKARFSTWVWTICRNNCIRFLKQKSRIPTVDNDLSEIYDSEMLSNSYSQDLSTMEYRVGDDGKLNNVSADDICIELYNVSLEEIQNMKDIGSQILKMKLIDNMKIREIAKQLDMNESTVKNHLYKSKENLSRILRINHKDLYDMYIESNSNNDHSLYV